MDCYSTLGMRTKKRKATDQTTERKTAYNSSLAQAGVQFFVGQFFRIIEVQFSNER